MLISLNRKLRLDKTTTGSTEAESTEAESKFRFLVEVEVEKNLLEQEATTESLRQELNYKFLNLCVSLSTEWALICF